MNSRSALIIATIILLIACNSGAPERPDEPTHEPAPTEEETVSQDDEPEFEGQPFEGRLEIDPVAGGKRFQGVWLVTDEGDRFLITYRPREKYFPYVDRRVIIDGEEFEPDPRTQHIMADHLRVHSIDVTGGDTPIEPAPDRLPAPPLVDDAGGLLERDGLWTLATGVLDSLEAPGKSTVYGGTLRLADESTLAIGSIDGEQALQYEGDEVTVLGRLHVGEDGKPQINRVLAICPGRAERCGIEDR